MQCLWPNANPDGPLKENEVHIWCAYLEPAADQLAKLEKVLSPEESQRAVRYRFWRHRRRYIAARGILRILLGHYLERSADSLIFSYSEYKKPFLPNSKLQFNLSHSKESAIFAFCLGTELGIDIEKSRAIDDAEGIASRFFAPTEYARFQELPDEEKDEAFFTCWTRKEAFIKAVGEGLSYPLADFDVSFSSKADARINSIQGSEERAFAWSLYPLYPVTGFVAALAIPGNNWKLNCRHFAGLF